jgi:hypothetical protein
VREWLEVLLYENIHHGGEIGLRNIYRESLPNARAG